MQSKTEQNRAKEEAGYIWECDLRQNIHMASAPASLLSRVCLPPLDRLIYILIHIYIHIHTYVHIAYYTYTAYIYIFVVAARYIRLTKEKKGPLNHHGRV